jgi:hypothetical protein
MTARGRTIYCALLLTSLAAIQLGAQIVQFRRGFRPALRPPTRVAFSWDMFAVAIDRCSIGWDPPLFVEGKSISSWRDRTYPIEFDCVYDQVSGYEAAATQGCAFRGSAATVARLMCPRRDGTFDERTIHCP